MKALVSIGISASGKSYFAQSIPEYHEINRDNIRKDILKSKGIEFNWKDWNWEWESEVTSIQHKLIEECAKNDTSIYISDTNLNYDRLQQLYQHLTKLGFLVRFKVFNVSFQLAMERDNARANGVGIYVIEKQRVALAKLLPQLANKSWFKLDSNSPLPTIKQHKHEPHKINTLLVDVDGTIAHMHNRSPFDWDKVKFDVPDKLLCCFLNYYLSDSNNHIIFLSGRDSICKSDTIDWINTNIPNVRFNQNAKLFMRAKSDNRKDYIIKSELFFNCVDNNYNVIAVFDDRPQVCRMWHDLGLKVWATGNQLIDF